MRGRAIHCARPLRKMLSRRFSRRFGHNCGGTGTGHSVAELGLSLVVAQVHDTVDDEVLPAGVVLNLDNHLVLLVDGIIVILAVAERLALSVIEADAADGGVRLGVSVAVLLELYIVVVHDASMGAIIGIQGQKPVFGCLANSAKLQRFSMMPCSDQPQLVKVWTQCQP